MNILSGSSDLFEQPNDVETFIKNMVKGKRLTVTKVRDSSVHLQLGHLLNRYPYASVDKIYRMTRKGGLIGSINTVWYTLEYMEENKIIDNPRCVIKNCRNYTNMHYILKIEDSKESMSSFITRYKNYIDMVHSMNAYRETYLYVKTHGTLSIPDKFQILEECTWSNFIPIIPHSTAEKGLSDALKAEPEAESVLDDFTVDEQLEWDNETWETFHWLCVNYRMSYTDLGKLIQKSPQAAYRRKLVINQSVILWYPIFIGGQQSYELLFFSFETKFPSFFAEVLSKNTGVSYLIQTSERTTLFVNTTIPKVVNSAMSRYEDTGIIRDLRRMYLHNYWDPIVERYMEGSIPERYFYMFKIGNKKGKRR
ncbi:MAG: hypothetical protein AYK19_19350 [Theionarchaea archaeon DG-70-1]|nr:MAG: hypothetical protein AYK19_19350 [Theionarchaea archaeon DG-70-1]